MSSNDFNWIEPEALRCSIITMVPLSSPKNFRFHNRMIQFEIVCHMQRVVSSNTVNTFKTGKISIICSAGGLNKSHRLLGYLVY